MEVKTSTTVLYEGNSYDETLVRIRVLDENDNLLPYAQLPLSIEVSGAIENAGFDLMTLEGGMGGVIVKTKGVVGKGTLSIKSLLGTEEIEFEVKNHEEKQ